MTDARAQCLRLIQSLYAAPGSVERWQAFLLDLCTTLEGTGANFISTDLRAQTATVALSVRIDPAAIRAYLAHWASVDPWVHSQSAQGLSAGTVMLGERMINRTAFKRTAFYNDYSRHYDVAQTVAAVVESGNHVLSGFSINGGERRAPFDKDDVALLDALVPHLQRALQIHRRIVGTEAVAQASMDALDRLHHAVLLIDARGRVLLANRVAEELLRERDGIAIDHGQLCAASPVGTTTLRQMIAGAIETSLGHGMSPGGVLALGRPSGRRPLQVVIGPSPRDRALVGVEDAGALMFVTDPERFPVPTEHEIRVLLGLTPAEARLARALAEGIGIEDAARRLGLTAGTLRTRLKIIFEKTGTHRQAELVRLVLHGVP